jgi:Mg2+/Co2+ transporter CorC
VWLLTHTTQGMLKLLRIDTNAVQHVTEEEINASLEEGVDAGIIEEHEHQMVRNVFLLDDRQLTSIMVPRSEIEWLDAQDSIDVAVQRAWTTGHSWYPVCRGGLDDVVGVIHLPRMLALQSEGNNETLMRHVQPAVFVPETLPGMELLEQFRERATRMVFVVDEYGVVQGLLTPLDMLEAITGELSPHAAVDAWATQREDGAWLIDGAMPVTELKSRLDIDELPDEDKGRYNTVAGLMQTVAGDLLAQADSVECAGWRFEVLVLDGRRIDQVLISRLSEPETTLEQVEVVGDVGEVLLLGLGAGPGVGDLVDAVSLGAVELAGRQAVGPDHGPGGGGRLAGHGGGALFGIHPFLRRHAEHGNEVGVLGHVVGLPVAHLLVLQHACAVPFFGIGDDAVVVGVGHVVSSGRGCETLGMTGL